jgi:hypothetical protein
MQNAAKVALQLAKDQVCIVLILFCVDELKLEQGNVRRNRRRWLVPRSKRAGSSKRKRKGSINPQRSRIQTPL